MKKNAFTLLEMLLVISISLTMITLTIYPIANTITALTEKQLLEEVKAAIYLAQIKAITSKQDTTISFIPNENQFIATYNNQPLITIPFGTTLSLQQTKTENYRFSSLDGTINRFSTIHLSGTNKNYKLIFQIGKGRFRVE
ncbi:competence type IV pilus minor pilin ComGD [Listeria innocua]|uniref:competence type IV pilus minor pilin ComGD n=1 Tax=Listeria innocua TaxID=1642 RepID=UPI0010EC0193|nr:competence type IV pilus minor pilin ComGD [Listeria innocua]EAD5704657.1 type II secretion system protein [Listeria innocua]EAD5751879.1 type II secretion system protein [Listeria innocua]EFO6642150.1 type II secretion system protein [Listeria innocua]EHF3653818.1 type II secretion system protein [Listeria innocua]EHF3672254.1 type II secretion system protein [Listeria innocua]